MFHVHEKKDKGNKNCEGGESDHTMDKRFTLAAEDIPHGGQQGEGDGPLLKATGTVINTFCVVFSASTDTQTQHSQTERSGNVA